MRDFCAEVVLKGTGKKAAVNGIAVAGKTGTSQKVVDGGYQAGKYVVSFIGFAPARDPRIVCVVVLDEPVYPYYWGGESSAIVFGKIVEGINLSTDLFCDAASANIAVDGKSGGSRRVPNFLRLTTDEAIDLASDRGLTVQCPDVKGIVFSQTPDPGTLIGRSEEVKLMVRAAAAESEASRSVPDVAGLSIREARRLLLSCGLDCVVRGFGIVERQDPPAGALLSRLARVMLICNPRSGDRTGSGRRDGERSVGLKLSYLLEGIDITKRIAFRDVEVTGIVTDSRSLKAGDCFVAIQGTRGGRARVRRGSGPEGRLRARRRACDRGSDPRRSSSGTRLSPRRSWRSGSSGIPRPASGSPASRERTARPRAPFSCARS